MARKNSTTMVDAMKLLGAVVDRSDPEERVAKKAREIFDANLSGDFEAALGAVYAQGALDYEEARPKKRRKQQPDLSQTTGG